MYNVHSKRNKKESKHMLFSCCTNMCKDVVLICPQNLINLFMCFRFCLYLLFFLCFFFFLFFFLFSIELQLQIYDLLYININSVCVAYIVALQFYYCRLQRARQYLT